MRARRRKTRWTESNITSIYAVSLTAAFIFRYCHFLFPVFFFRSTWHLFLSIFADHTVPAKKRRVRGFYRINFSGMLFSSIATNFAAVILNVNTEWSRLRTAYGYRDRLRVGNNSNISHDNISSDLSETANVFITSE